MKARGLKGTKCPHFVGAVNLKYECRDIKMV